MAPSPWTSIVQPNKDQLVFPRIYQISCWRWWRQRWVIHPDPVTSLSCLLWLFKNVVISENILGAVRNGDICLNIFATWHFEFVVNLSWECCIFTVNIPLFYLISLNLRLSSSSILFPSSSTIITDLHRSHRYRSPPASPSLKSSPLAPLSLSSHPASI